MKKLIFRLFLTALVGAGAWGGYTALKRIPQTRQSSLPTTRVRQGDVIVRSYARGELRAVRSYALTAPNLFGTVQVTKLAPLGAFAREKDLIVEFDDSELLSRVEEKQLEIDQVDEQLKKSQADLAIRNNQDQVELLRARYSVRRAELEVKRNELIAPIDAKKNELNLQEAKRRLTQLESDIKSRQAQAQAELEVLRSRKDKALVEMAREKARLQTVKLLTPMSGLVSIKQNRGGYFTSGQTLPDIREGDQLQPGMPVADVLDLSEMEVVARVGELDRANLYEGQEVVITLDALADKRLTGKIKSMSGTASSNIFSNDPAKKFDVIFGIDMRELLTHLGAGKDQIERVLAQAEVNRNKNVSSAPSSAFAGFGAGGGPSPEAMAAFAGRGGGGRGQGEEGGPRVFGFRQGGGAEGQGQEGQAGRGQGRGGFGAGLTDEQRQKLQEIRQRVLGGRSMQDLSAEERQEIMQKLQAELAKEGITMPQRGGPRGGGQQGGAGQPAAGQQGEQQAGEGQARGGRGGRGERGAGGAESAGGRGGRPGGGMGFAASRFTEAELANAKLPPPPEEDDQLEVLLRPGLLADVEIIVEKIPNAIHVPAQAVFDRDGRSLVFVKEGNRFTAREVKLLKRSENTMVIASGLKAGEEISLSDPEARPGEGKKEGGKGGGGSGAPMMPAGKGGA